MSQVVSVSSTTDSPQPPVWRQSDDPFRYGRRYVRRELPDGTSTFEIVPLTQEDLLHPWEGDEHLCTPRHNRARNYGWNALKISEAHVPRTQILEETNVDFGLEGLKAFRPDFAVFRDVIAWNEQAGTFVVQVYGGKPVLAAEVTSPDTRDNDLGIKKDIYWKCGFQIYLILDYGPKGESSVELIAYRRVAKRWEKIQENAEGRLDLSPLHLLVGIEKGDVRFYLRSTGERIGTPEELAKAKQAAERAVQSTQEALDKANERVQSTQEALDKAKDQVQQEVEAKQAAERAALSAQEALNKANERVQQEVEAKQTAERTAQSAQEALDKANERVQQEVKAKQTAERTAQLAQEALNKANERVQQEADQKAQLVTLLRQHGISFPENPP